MTLLPHCPVCNAEYTYEDGIMYVCPSCGHEWPLTVEPEQGEPTS